MGTNPVLARVHALWEGLAAVPVSFSSPEPVDVAISPAAMICPQGWVGIVVLQGRAIMTAPDSETAAALRGAVTELSVEDLVDPEVLGTVLPLAGVLGPATLAYVDEFDFRAAVSGSVSVDRLPADHPDLRRLENVAGEQESTESGLGELTSPAFTVQGRDGVVAAAGYRTWPSRTAHMSVLTAPENRGQGLARLTGSAAVAHALEAGLLPQWRARAPQSRRVAIALGFQELGSQLSVRPS
ncbi:GNAT family N-acetyltransferase [Nocardia noduli]|uniref:GNAT family N-acetyltransferase n=1 Tax=Nocardia noduli TaxID=2815722 RepID=UPI001C249BF2|nr:GNAT family N-acetyltransferase [Nocardia noduli]